ncbi:MAG TPA: 6-hydroxycyclohex-1-ene-1-carbonyl-CoA dehydrogenase [Candidatus Polarisedimenticolaceae bacterium]|nr:6-hydroxycyclohex-1-ene-1-carbonyl-CoA dehydrogenase [Candidatus Polarisedimenticolaceae bacterium]
MNLEAWVVEEPGRPMARRRREVTAGPGEVVIEVAGCGLCHTDLGFYYDAVPTRHPFPLTLGHEIAGRVVETGEGAEEWRSCAVIVPAVIPCGACAACAAGRSSICPEQIFPGNDVHGGFATHVVVPSRGLCRVPDLRDPRRNPLGVELAQLSVIADAVSTPWEAIRRSGLASGDLAVFVGAGGVGGFGVQLAAAVGAAVVAIDVDERRLERLAGCGASLVLNAAIGFRELKRAVRDFADRHDAPSWRRKIFETSGTAAGQATAFGLLEHGGHLAVVGFTPERVELRLSNLMAFDATAQGNWGCPPEHYPALVDLALSGKIALQPFTERRPLSSINEAFADVHAHRVDRRVILSPER